MSMLRTNTQPLATSSMAVYMPASNISAIAEPFSLWIALLQRCSERTPESDKPPTSDQTSERQGEEEGAPTSDEVVEEASEESFPASDAPSWTPTEDVTPPEQ